MGGVPPRGRCEVRREHEEGGRGRARRLSRPQRAARAPFLARDFAGAEAEYKKALELNPAAAVVYGQLAVVQTELQKKSR